MQTGNLFTGFSVPQQGETFETLLSHKNLVIERIVSAAELSPQQYRQAQDEWVVLLKGTATLEADGKTIELNAGDYLFLPANTPHTVKRASHGALWLAIHLY
ncbi:cupin domain-containing protein [Nitrosomonas sp. HPC101]|uniref:cupin domain-containing protein n=1 Tax=Nitrosomonas sp. HPC101 TaxID=1658667 RepID=UPI00136B0BCC|nr:cupin domain-containing protein [Nitrosomonas sp. HPC101]MXS85479.1 cupin domain-containing protein [Nitrosomonas sp. HPC101]